MRDPMRVRIGMDHMPTMPGTFRAPHAPSRQERQRATERARGSAHARGYDRRWGKASRAFLDKHQLCPACKVMGITALATVTDHIIPHKGDKALFWSRKNWQPACAWHHNAVKQRLECEYLNGRISEKELVLTSSYAIFLARSMKADATGGN